MRRKKFTSLLLTFSVVATLYTGLIGGNKAAYAAETSKDAPKALNEVKTQDRKIIGYFPEWAYSQESHENYTADRIPWDKVTHVNYAFAVVNSETNKIDFGDKKAAIEMEFPGQSDEFKYKGHFNVLSTYKKKYPNVKTLISVGGWVGSTGFYTMCQTPQGREAFANSCVDFIREYGFDGVDIDYEYPTATKEAGNPNDFKVSEPNRGRLYADYCEMMKLLREKLDAASKEDSKKYLLTAALPASSWILGGMGLGEYAEYLDYANLMTYDFHGAWNGHVGPQSALYPDSRDTETANFAMPVLNIDWAYRYFSGILPPEKINIGVPYYTRGWKDVSKGTVEGGLWGTAAKEGGGAIGEDNIWHDLDENGNEEPAGSNPLWHAKNLLENKDYKYYWDDVTKTPYIWNENKKVFLTYEDEKSIQAKLDYIIQNKLGGVMMWELDGDYGKKEDGTYGVGDTLTTFMSDYFKKADPLVIEENKEIAPSKNYEVTFTGKYEHPNYDFSMVLKNNTGEEIKPGWELEFDLPKSAYVTNAWGVTMQKLEDHGTFTRYKITGPGWCSIPNGGSYKIDGSIKLCFSGGPQNFTLNGFSSEAEVGKIAPSDDMLPLKAQLTSSILESKDGNYNIDLKVPKDSRATSYKLYENDKVIKGGTLTANKEETISFAGKNKANGKYTYKAVLTNVYGDTVTDEVTVNVVREDGQGEEAAKVDVKFDVSSDWGTGSQYNITITNTGDKAIKSWELEVDYPITITSAWNCQFTSAGNGVYIFKSNSWAAPIEPGKSYTFSGAALGGAKGQEPYNISAKVVYVE